MAPKAKQDTEGKLRDLIKETFTELMDGREKESRAKSESKEQQWVRQAIREEVGSFFEDFLKGMDEGKKAEGEPEGGEGDDDEGGEGGGSFLRALVGGKK